MSYLLIIAQVIQKVNRFLRFWRKLELKLQFWLILGDTD